MKKNKLFSIFLLVLWIGVVDLCRSQSFDSDILAHYKEKRLLDFEHSLFTPNELIEYCTDSLGKEVFLKSIGFIRDELLSNSPYALEQKVLMTMIKSNIDSVAVESHRQKESKNFISGLLEEFQLSQEVDDSIVLERFMEEDEVSYCSSCISMYIFFVYDPELYIRVRKKEKGFLNAGIHFPLAYILQNCDIPIEVAAKMKRGLLERTMNHDDPIIIKMRSEFQSCDIYNRCD